MWGMSTVDEPVQPFLPSLWPFLNTALDRHDFFSCLLMNSFASQLQGGIGSALAGHPVMWIRACVGI